VHVLALCILPMNIQCIWLLCASCQWIYSACACSVHPTNGYTVYLVAVCILPMNIQCIWLLCASYQWIYSASGCCVHPAVLWLTQTAQCRWSRLNTEGMQGSSRGFIAVLPRHLHRRTHDNKKKTRSWQKMSRPK